MTPFVVGMAEVVSFVVFGGVAELGAEFDQQVARTAVD